MAVSTVTFMRGKEWWLSKTRKNGREVYPERILVGKLYKERVYLPCRYPMDDEKMAAVFDVMKGDDAEIAHIMADAMLVEFLKSCGYRRSAEAFERLPKWYS